MALISCPECLHDVSDRAAACPKCGHPIAAEAPAASAAPVVPPQASPSARHAGPPVNCSNCGGSLKKGSKATSEGSGCLVVILGLVLTPILLGIPIVIYGLHLMSKREGFWRCRKCGAKFDREIKWYQFG